MGYTGGGSSDKRGSTSSGGGNGRARARMNGGGSGRRHDWGGDDTSDEGGMDGEDALDCDESLDAAATDDEVRSSEGFQRHVQCGV